MRPARRITRYRHSVAVAALASLAVAAPVEPSARAGEPSRIRGTDLAVERLVVDPATGNPRLVRLASPAPAPDGDTLTTKALDLLTRHAAAFGLVSPSDELRTVAELADPVGGGSVFFRQFYLGLPVFGATVRVHFDAGGTVRAVNGAVVSDIDLDPSPRLSALDAENMARRAVAKPNELRPEDLAVDSVRLLVYRTGLVRGRPGDNHLAWEVEVASPPIVREVVYFDAGSGRLLDRRSKIHRIDRRVHLHRMPNPIWSEGDPLPFASGNSARDAEVNEMISATGDIHTLMANLTGGQYLSFDGFDATMNAVYDADSLDCPNAVESNGVTAYCVDMVSDDVVAHEWAHAYTEWTHALVYQWQPGALNEAYSDIYGELVDQLNGRGSDLPDDLRGPGECSLAGGSPSPTLDILQPAAAAGRYPAGGAVFNPPGPWSVTAPVELADDGIGATSDACQPVNSFPAGAVALIDRGLCLFRDKVRHAQDAGAAGAIIVNNQGDSVLDMGGDLEPLDIPAILIGQSDGARIRGALNQGVTATLELTASLSATVRWLIGEDTGALGAIRDMWSPSCFGDPDRVGSANYSCQETDNGGVHTNSGVANHAFALLVDGGAFNGGHIRAIGATKAARIYWRAMSRYQTPVSNFTDHADLLEISCEDLIGAQLYDPGSGDPIAETVTADDCLQVAAAMRAVEMRQSPDQCGFRPLLDPDPPAATGNVTLFDDGFDDPPGSEWILHNHGVYPEYEPRDWVWTDDLPEGGVGGGWFAIDSVFIGDCIPGSDDQSGVMELISPPITVPEGVTDPVLVFDHWISTEPDWDGGNLKIGVDGGPWMTVPGSVFKFNPYNGRINPPAGSNPNSNPLAGEPAFTGANPGVLGGSWGQSQVDLGSLIGPGDIFALRFDFGVDGCNGAEGWYLGRVRVTADGRAPRHPGGRVAP